mmetsp:Transcript_7197/g.20398  ORF Transcript_7197/g.20398 Transcript_7197/m.20398 type:complete len:165 (-) Transcript_7197:47-541(-)
MRSANAMLITAGILFVVFIAAYFYQREQTAAGGVKFVEMAEGKQDVMLRSCPKSPNCVSSQAKPDDDVHFIEAFRVEGLKDPLAILDRIILSLDRTERVPSETKNYAHYIFVTRILRFKDDVELLFDEEKQIVHVRSASRVGYGDLGANRKRVELIRKLLDKEK